MRAATLSAALLLLNAPAWAGVIMGMRQEIRSESGIKSYDSTMYVVPMAARFDMEPSADRKQGEGEPAAGKVSFIIRLDERKVWFVMSGARTYYEMGFETLRRYQDEGTFGWKNSNPFHTGTDVKYLKVKGRRRILKAFAQQYQVIRGGEEGYDLAWVRETPRSIILDRFAANQKKVFAQEGIAAKWEDPPGVPLAARAFMDNGDRVDWHAVSLRSAKIAADTFRPPKDAQAMSFSPDTAALWMKGIGHFKTAFKEAVKADVERRAKDAAEHHGKKAMEKAFQGLFR